MYLKQGLFDLMMQDDCLEQSDHNLNSFNNTSKHTDKHKAIHNEKCRNELKALRNNNKSCIERFDMDKVIKDESEIPNHFKYIKNSDMMFEQSNDNQRNLHNFNHIATNIHSKQISNKWKTWPEKESRLKYVDINHHLEGTNNKYDDNSPSKTNLQPINNLFHSTLENPIVYSDLENTIQYTPFETAVCRIFLIA